MRPFAVLLLALALAAPCAPARAAATIGSPAPPVSGTLPDGSPVAAHALSGKVVVLNFWATWCPPCRAETADLVTAYRRLGSADVAFLGIDTTEGPPVVSAFLSAKGVPFPTALAARSAYDAFGISFIPTTIVLDRHGIVRARWVGGVVPAQLARYVAAARDGRSADWVTPAQARIDRLLAPPRGGFAGDPAHRTAALAALDRTLAAADAIAEHNASTVDFERTTRAEGRLRLAAAQALRGADDPALRDRSADLLARGYADLGRYADVVALARERIAERGEEPALVRRLALALYRNHDYDGMIAETQRLTQLTPDDGDAWSLLGLAYQRTHAYDLARPAYETGIAKLIAALHDPAPQDALANVADTSLDLADVDASLGDPDAARTTYAQAARYGARLDARRYAELRRNILERTQEGTIAATLARGDGRTGLSVAPWTGPDLPGSVASTFKYRLLVAAAPQARVTLHATGLGPHWIASFCADGLCAPQQVSFRAPASGVKTYEFQLVPPSNGARPGAVGIASADGASARLP